MNAINSYKYYFFNNNSIDNKITYIFHYIFKKKKIGKENKNVYLNK